MMYKTRMENKNSTTRCSEIADLCLQFLCLSSFCNFYCIVLFQFLYCTELLQIYIYSIYFKKSVLYKRPKLLNFIPLTLNFILFLDCIILLNLFSILIYICSFIVAFSRIILIL